MDTTRETAEQSAGPGELPEAPDARDSQLLAVICHDLRAPLASIVMGVGFIQQSMAKVEGRPTEKRILEGLLRSTARMNALIGDLHDLTHIEAGTFRVSKQRFAVSALLASAVTAHAGLGAKKQIALETGDGSGDALVACDRDRIVQSIGRLIDNAVRYSAEGHTVRVVADVKEGRAQFSVTDDGKGMSPERLEHAFDHRWHSAQSPRDGTGLGLALVRGVARAHGGDAEVLSPPGKGTHASFWLPAA